MPQDSPRSHRSCILRPVGALTAQNLFGDARRPPAGGLPGMATLNSYLDAKEAEYNEHMLAANDYRIADTAAALGISRKNLWEKMKRLGIAGKEGHIAA